MPDDFDIGDFKDALGPPRVISDSSCVASHKYDPETGTLDIEFQQRGEYRYKHVPPEEYAMFAASASLGTYFNRNIRNNYDYERIG